MNQYRDSVAAPYIDGSISNIKSRFSDNSLKLVVSFSCFDPSLFPSDDSSLSDYGNDQLKTLVEFCGNEQTTTYEGSTYTSPPLIDGVVVYTEWRLFKRAFVKESRALVETKQLTKPPSL